MKKKSYCLLALFMSLAIITSVYAADPTTLRTQPPTDSSDCQSNVEVIDAENWVCWLRNGYVSLSFNMTIFEQETLLDCIEFYRGNIKILTFIPDENFVKVWEEEQPYPDLYPVLFVKLQWYDHETEGWDTWDAENEIPDEYFAYRQQIIVRVVFQDDLDDPLYVLSWVFTITRGMPWIQTDVEITNRVGVDLFFEFIPSGYFWVPTNRAILSSDLAVWNEITGMNYGNSFASDSWFTVGFTATDIQQGAAIQLFNGTFEDLVPIPYNAIIGHSAAANWTTDYTDGDLYSYNYTFMLGNLNSIPKWHIAELWVPDDTSQITLYYSTDNGTTWTHGIDYSFYLAEGTATGFKTTNGTDINATIYWRGTPGEEDIEPVISTPNADPPPLYDYSDFYGVINRNAFGLEFPGDTGQNIYDSSSYCLIKAQVSFAYYNNPHDQTATYYFDTAIANGRLEFIDEPEQDYDLSYQTDGRLQFVTANSANSRMWGIGTNISLGTLAIRSYANTSLSNAMFGCPIFISDGGTAAHAMNLLAFLSLDTRAYAERDPAVPDIFELGSADNPRFQYHESIVKTTFMPLETYLFGTQRRWTLTWAQTASTDWESIAIPTIALSERWSPSPTPPRHFRRAASPATNIYDSYELTEVDFALVLAGGTGAVGVGEPTPTPPPAPPLSILQLAETETIAIITAAVIITIVAIVYLLMRKP